MPCSLCGEERCTCISSVLDAIEPPAPPRREEAVVAHLRPPPLDAPPAPAPPAWPPSVPPPPGWASGGWPHPGSGPSVPWRGGAPSVYAGRRRYDLLVTDHSIALVPAGPALERIFLLFGLVGALVGAAIDRGQGTERMRCLLGSPPDAVLADRNVRVVAREQVQSIQVVPGRGSGSATFHLHDGERVRLRWTRQPHVPALLQATFGGLAAVGPRPAWERALRGLALVVVVLFLFAVLGLAGWAIADSDTTPTPAAATDPSTTPPDVLERRAHYACQLASDAFEAPPERLALDLNNAADAMSSAADVDERYRRAALALTWFRDHTVNGQFDVSEAEAGPYLDALDQACTAHLASTPTTGPSQSF